MNYPKIDRDLFVQSLTQATKSLRNNDCDNAYGLIIEAMRIDPNSPHPHNLLGILDEMSGDGSLARRHYRAAYSLDPTYKPACRNLERICTDFDDKPSSYDFGDVPEKADEHIGVKRLKHNEHK